MFLMGNSELFNFEGFLGKGKHKERVLKCWDRPSFI